MTDAAAPPKELPILHTERLTLRRLETGDADALFRLFSDADVTRYWFRLPYTDRAEALDLVERTHVGISTGSAFQWGVTRRDEDRVIGTSSLFQIDPTRWRGEIGYALARDAWGQGVMQEAMAAVVAYAFESFGLHRLEADTDPRNAASRRLLERLGFTLEGTLRERWRVGDEISDTAFYGLLHSEWQARR